MIFSKTKQRNLLLLFIIHAILLFCLLIYYYQDSFIVSLYQPSSLWNLNNETHVYEYRNKPPIWLYWDKFESNNPLPPHICLSLKSIYCHNHQDFTIKLITKETLPHYVNNIHSASRYFIPTHRADYFRSRILEQYGGIYLDIDAVALQSLKKYYNHLKNHDIVTHSDGAENISMGILGPVRAGHLLFRQYIEKAHRLFDKRYNKSINITRDVFGWSEMGGGITIPTFHRLMKLNLTNPMIYNGRSTIIQFVHSYPPLAKLNSSHLLMKRLNLARTPLLYYHNSGIQHTIKKLYSTEESFLKSNTALAHLFLIALKNCTQLPTCQTLQRILT